MQEEAVQMLVGLGLTVLQAKVYIALVKSGTSNGRATAKAAKVASQDVYRVLVELQEKGLIEKIIAKPNEYRPIPLKHGLLMLLQQRNKQTIELKRTAFEVFNTFQIIDKHEDRNETSDFILISQKKPIENKIAKIWKTAQVNVDLINDFQLGMEWHEKDFELEIKALDKGIKIRDVFSKTQRNYLLTKAFSVLLERKPEFQAKYINFPPPARLMIKDHCEVFISTTRNVNALEYPYLWSNNPIIVQIIQKWYDTTWEKAKVLQKTLEKQSTTNIMDHRASSILPTPIQNPRKNLELETKIQMTSTQA